MTWPASLKEIHMWALLEDVPIALYVINHRRLLFDEWLHWVASVISVFFASAVASFHTGSLFELWRDVSSQIGDDFSCIFLRYFAILSEGVWVKFVPGVERISLLSLQPVYIPHWPPCKHACQKCQLQNRWSMFPPTKDSIHVSDQVFDCVWASLVSLCVCSGWTCQNSVKIHVCSVR